MQLWTPLFHQISVYTTKVMLCLPHAYITVGVVIGLSVYNRYYIPSPFGRDDKALRSILCQWPLKCLAVYTTDRWVSLLTSWLTDKKNICVVLLHRQKKPQNICIFSFSDTKQISMCHLYFITIAVIRSPLQRFLSYNLLKLVTAKKNTNND